MKSTHLLNITSFISAILAYLTVITYIGIYYNIFFIALYTFAIFNESYLHIKFPRLLLNISSIFLVILFSYKINMDTVNVVILRCLILLLLIKLITPKTDRDYLQIIALVFFLVAGAALINLNITYLILTLLVILISILQMLILSFYNFNEHYYFNKVTFTAIIKNFAYFTILLIPLTVLLFIIMPRSNYPFFDILNKQDKAISGFADSISLGKISNIDVDEGVAFRVKMSAINKKDLFWRGVELNTFEGDKWTYQKLYENNKKWLENKKTIRQEIYLQPLGSKYILSLDKPAKVINERNNIIIKSHMLFLNRKVNKPIHYTAFSVPSEVIYQPIINKNAYTQLPVINKRIVELADHLKGRSELETVQNTLKYLNSPEFKYVIEDLPVSNRPLYEFLFENKKGNCELFASAFAVMLRLNGIPVRLISGFYGGEYNSYFNYYAVFLKNAHVWAEVWIDGRWIRINPSPVEIGPTFKEGYFKNIRMLIDSLQYYWTIYVINYDLEKQIKLFKKVKKPFANTSKIFRLKPFAILFAIVIFSFMLVIVIVSIKNVNKKRSEKLIQLLENKIRKKYKINRNNMTLSAYINKLPLSLEKKKELEEIILIIMEHFYKDIDIGKEEFNRNKRKLKLILMD